MRVFSRAMPSAFDILGLPARFALDERELERRYRERARALHPDRVGGAAIGDAVDLNAAYRTLKDDLTRARALLDARGSGLAEEGRREDPELLVTVMELREALERARDRGDETAIAALATRARGDYEAARDRLAAALDANDHESAERHLARMRYYRRLLDEVDAIEDANLVG